MTKEQYKIHLCDVIHAVFAAEGAINERDKELKGMLKKHIISPQQYVSLIAEEMMSRTPENELERIITDEDNTRTECCGNCYHFTSEDAEGYGWCAGGLDGECSTHCSNYCNCHKPRKK